MYIFDTNIFVACFWEDDKRHQQSLEYFNNSKEQILLPKPILVEIVTVLSKRTLSTEPAKEFLNFIEQDSRFLIIDVPFEEVLQLRKTINQPTSFEDIVIIYTALKYDAKIISYDKELLIIYDDFVEQTQSIIG